MGEHRLGRGGVLGFTDRTMSRDHAVLTVTADGATLTDLASSNGTLLEGEPVTAPDTAVAFGQVFRLGDTALVLVPAATSDAAIEPAGPGTRAFVRAPRLLPSQRPVRIQLPEEPRAREARRIPMLMVLAPLAIGIVLAVVLRSPLYLMFAFASPLMMIGNAVSDRRQTARENREARRRYDRELAVAQERIALALTAETARRRALHADPAAALLTAALPGRRLWNDGAATPTHWISGWHGRSARGGRGDRPPTPDEPRTVRSVPATVPLREFGVLGLAGPADQLAGLLRWVALQLAIHHPPRDLAMTLLTSRARSDWNWLRWLPHTRTADATNRSPSWATTRTR